MTRTCLFISGYGAPGFEWLISPIPHLLRCYDWDVKVFRSGFGCPGERAEQIADDISGIRGEIFAVGHSMGGVVCEALDVMSGRLTQVVTLGSPLGGVPLASVLPGCMAFGSIRQIRERSRFLQRTRNSDHSAEYLSVAGTRDRVVSRMSAFAIPHAVKAVVPCGHVELFRRPDVARLVGEFFGVVASAALEAA